MSHLFTNSMVIILKLPKDLLEAAYEVNSELSWRPKDLARLSSVLKDKSIAVLGGELWEKSANGPIIDSELYQWSSPARKGPWEQYVSDTLKQMEDFVESIPLDIRSKPNAYINVEMVLND